MLTRMSPSEIEKLAESGKITIPQRLLDALQRIAILEMTDEEVAVTIRTKLPEVSGEGRRDSTENKTRRYHQYEGKAALVTRRDCK